MSAEFELTALPRDEQGKGASRRLRREGRVPAVIYGAGQAPEVVSLEHRELSHNLEHEAFYSHVLKIKLGERVETAILRDLQRHPYKPVILHVDLQRVAADQKIHVHVPLHFVNEEASVGVKQQGGAVSHHLIEVDVACLPGQLPEFIEVDLAGLEVGQSLHLSDLVLPEGIELTALTHGTHADQVVVSIHAARGGAEEEGAASA